MSKIFLESLDTNRQKVFSKLNKFKNFGVLGGGTALALQINHRISYDFDIFTNEKIDKNLWKKSDVKSYDVEYIGEKVGPKEIKNFLEGEVKDYKNKILG